MSRLTEILDSQNSHREREWSYQSNFRQYFLLVAIYLGFLEDQTRRPRNVQIEGEWVLCCLWFEIPQCSQNSTLRVRLSPHMTTILSWDSYRKGSQSHPLRTMPLDLSYKHPTIILKVEQLWHFPVLFGRWLGRLSLLGWQQFKKPSSLGRASANVQPMFPSVWHLRNRYSLLLRCRRSMSCIQQWKEVFRWRQETSLSLLPKSSNHWIYPSEDCCGDDSGCEQWCYSLWRPRDEKALCPGLNLLEVVVTSGRGEVEKFPWPLAIGSRLQRDQAMQW